jgi:hypothetical protein
MIPSMETVRELATLQSGEPVLSLHIRTDPRDPANNATTPKWLVELRNGLREVADTVNAEEPRSQRLARRELSARAESEVLALNPSDRARGLAWFLTSDGAVNLRFPLQLPPRATLVRWDDRPFVSPLVDVVDRGRPTGLVLVSAEAIRLLHWQLAGWRSQNSRCMSSNPANGATTTRTLDIPGARRQACMSRRSISGSRSGGSGSSPRPPSLSGSG